MNTLVVWCAILSYFDSRFISTLLSFIPIPPIHCDSLRTPPTIFDSDSDLFELFANFAFTSDIVALDRTTYTISFQVRISYFYFF